MIKQRARNANRVVFAELGVVSFSGVEIHGAPDLGSSLRTLSEYLGVGDLRES